jgi:hypothetical protein
MILAKFSRLAALLAGLLVTLPVTAQIRSIVVPAHDGYGLSECLAENGACGQGVAEAWCHANGLGKAVTYGRAKATDVTGSIGSRHEIPTDSFIVTCGD